jgi:flavodoxin
MRILIVYSSLTGNTKMIGEAVYREIAKNTEHSAEIFPVETAPEAKDYDLAFIGYWADKGGADPKTKAYLAKEAAKKTALFFTLGASPDSKHADNIFINAKNLMPQDAQVLGHFRCMGKIAPRILELTAKGLHGVVTPERAARLEEAKKHPNEADCLNAGAFAADILKKAVL